MDNSSQQQKQAQIAQASKPDSEREDFRETLLDLKKQGTQLRSDVKQPSLLDRPAWFDQKLYNNAKSVYARHFMAVNFSHLSGLLMLVRINSIFRTLKATGKSDSVSKLFNRYYQTIIHVKKWYEGDIFEENSDAHRSLLIVRGMHNKVSSSLNNDNQASSNDNNEQLGFHLSEYDLMITQFAFVGFIVLHSKSVGLLDAFDRQDLASMLHFWRVIGHYLGASEKYNLCTGNLDTVRGMCEAIRDIEFKQSIEANPISSPPGLMSLNILRSVKFIPMITIYGMFKYLYELLGIDTDELESRASRYSRVSHYLIGLVMTRLLGYRALRSFNNGLTRLSVFLVGKMQERFSSYLDSKYGQELKSI